MPSTDHATPFACLEGKRVVVTGGTGSFGRAFVDELLRARAASVLAISRDEMKHAALRRTWNAGVTLRIGDVTRREDCARALRDADVVVHAAAMKHLPECELNPLASTRVNVLGTANLLDAFLHSGAETFVFLSTDKAPYASTAYGAQKLLAEKLVTETAALAPRKRAFSLRYSNVIDSTGAAFPLFRQLLSEGKTATVNGSQTARGFLSQAQVLRVLGRALELGRGGEVFVPIPRVVRIADLARTLCAVLGKGEVVVKEAPGSAGEKESATLVMAEEVALARALPECTDPSVLLLDSLRRHEGRGAPRDLAARGLTLEDCPRLEGEALRELVSALV